MKKKTLDVDNNLLNLLNNPLFLKLLDAFQIGISILGPDGTILYFNDSEYSIFGIDKDSDCVGKSIKTLFRTNKSFWDAINSKKRNSYPTISISGVEGITFRTPVLNAQGDIMCCVVETITTTLESTRINELLSTISLLKQKAEYYDAKIFDPYSRMCTFKEILGDSAPMKRLKVLGERFAKSSAPILILGESGTGKELIAQALHMASDRADKPFVAVNCAALPPTLAESELFGYVGGAFSGASSKGMKGKFELSHQGTIFLDEVGELPLSIQAKLLRVLENKEVQKIGSSKPVYTDFRLIAATNRDLVTMVKEKRFREDLYHRLSILELEVPPLRERRDDLPLLIRAFLQQSAGEQRSQKLRISEEVIHLFKRYEWPGNVRELKNILTSVICSLAPEESVVGLQHLPMRFLEQNMSREPFVSTEEHANLASMRANIERQTIMQALIKNHNNKSQTAAELGISRNNLYKKIKKLHIDIDI